MRGKLYQLTPLAEADLEEIWLYTFRNWSVEQADSYHRDLSYHQGTAWTWLTGSYIEALVNVYGPGPETVGRVKLLLQPLTAHLLEEGCLGQMAEIFDGSRPHLARGCPAHAAATAACMRWLGWQIRQ